MKGWLLGAYAGYASFPGKTRETDAAFRAGLEELPHVRGLELPVYSDLSETGSDKFLRTLPKHWEYALTLLPGTMQSLSVQAEFGLASPVSDGRKAAMSRMALVHRRVHGINARCGGAAVKAIQMHSAPTGGKGSTESLYRSLSELMEWEWQGAKLMIEHCDAWQPDGSSVKGFLPLTDELKVLKQLDLDRPLSLNWGRSTLEAKDPAAPLEHIRLAGNLLGAFFFSGTALDGPLYGSWTDSHVPLQVGSSQPWEPTKGLLTSSRVNEIWNILKEVPEIIWGIKVQPAPPDLSVAARLDFLAQQLLAFESARTGD